MQIFTVYSKDLCPFCDKAIALLEAKFETFNVVKVPTDLARDDLETMVEGFHEDNPDWKLTVPQIFIEGEIGSRSYIGGFDDLEKWYQSREVDSDLDDMSL